MKTVAVYHLKEGGVGKTSTSVNLAYLFARAGYKTLICDLDSQGSTTFYFRIKPKVKSKTRSLVKGGKNLDRFIKGTDFDNLDLLPADSSFRKLDIKLEKARGSKKRLKQTLAGLRDEYDVIVLDCPPGIGLTAENIFNAADLLLVPVIPTPLSLLSYEEVKKFLRKKKYRTKTLKPFFSMVEKRKKIQKEAMAEALAKYGEFLDSAIPYASDVERMGTWRKPVVAAKPACAASKQYKALFGELGKFLKLAVD